MGKYGKFLISEAEQNPIDEALKFVDGITSHSQIVGSLGPEAIEYLQKSVLKSPLKLYRGIGLIRPRLAPELFEIAEKLKIGNELPSFLTRSSSRYSSYSKKLTIARQYSEGEIAIVVEAMVDKKDILVDTENLVKIMPPEQDIIDQYDIDYFKQDKEVLVIEPIKATIITFNISR